MKSFNPYTATQRRILTEAIRKKKVVTFSYNSKFRVMCPHFIGRTGKTEKCLLLQIDGYSETGLSENEEENWRCMNLHAIRDIRIVDTPEWHSAPNANRRKQKCIERIEVSL